MINKLLFAGMPQTGKTTYIAALWYYIFNSFTNENYIVDTSINEEREYLNTRTAEWTNCETVLRTSQGIIEQVTISMKEKSTGKEIVLNIPDISGETFRRQFSLREWDLSFEKIIADVYGMILFIDPMDERNVPKFIHQNNIHYKYFGEAPPPQTSAESWSLDNVPNQVKLVDFLQAISFYNPDKIFRISIVISCWDLVEKTLDPKTPEDWCQKKMPLLFQYMSANDTVFLTKYFGISAQGGDYENDKEKKSLSEISPLDRIVIVEGKNKSNNILSPILWITNENKN